MSSSSYVTRLALGKVADHIQSKPSIVDTDPEIRAAMDAAASSTKKHWWKKRPQADIILSAHDRQVLRSVKKRAWYLDRGCQCCCLQVGLDGVVGLIPVVGDFIGVLLALHLVRVACRADLPSHIIAKMLANVFFDFILGLAPVAGDVLDVLYQCNWRNALILEEYLFLRRLDEIRAEQGAAGYGSTGSTSQTVRTQPAATAPNTTKTTATPNSHSSNKSNGTGKAAGGSDAEGGSKKQAADTKIMMHHDTTTKRSDIPGNVRKNTGGPRPREYATFISIDTRA